MSDLRDWLAKVEAMGELKTLEGVDWDLDIGAITELVARQPRRAVPALDTLTETERLCPPGCAMRVSESGDTDSTGSPITWLRLAAGVVGSTFQGFGVGMFIGAHWKLWEQAFQLAGSRGCRKAGSLRFGRCTGCAGQSGLPPRQGGLATQPSTSSWYG